MRAFNLGVSGIVAGVFLFGSVGSVSAIEPFDLNSVSLQYQREVRSTYIIQFRADVAPSEVKGRANAIAARFQGRLRHTYTRALNGFSIRMNAGAMANLLDAEDLGIASISRAVLMTVAQSNENAAPQGRNDNPGGGGGGGGGPKNNEPTCDQSVGWNILRVTTLTEENTNCLSSGGTPGFDDYSISGGATNLPTVCVLDTGVSDHEDLNVSSSRYNFSSSENDDDTYGHGTHVAGIIGAIANDKGVVGVAPGVEITSIKVLDNDGFGFDADVIAGIEKAFETGVDCDIVNMSLGGSGSDPLDNAVKNASTASNIIFTLAAGNSAADISGYSPARASTGPNDNIFTIASFGQERKTNLDLWSSFSNYDAGNSNSPVGVVDFALPGGKIRSTVPGGYNTYNGTSMAAPHMAGLLVRYLVENGGGTGRVEISSGAMDTSGFIQREVKIGKLSVSYPDTYPVAVDLQ